MTETTTLLWTGGWDSTYRLCELVLTEGRPVQPFFLLVDARPHKFHELRAMDRIWTEVRRRAEDPSVLRPTMILHYDPHGTMPASRELRETWEATLRRHPRTGGQYLQLAAALEMLSLKTAELCIVRNEGGDERNRQMFTDVDAGDFSFTDTPEGRMFSRFSMPLMKYNKGELRQQAQDAGFLDILQMTWFCQDPLGDRPCGVCNPCLYAPQTGEKIEPAPRYLLRARSIVRRTRSLRHRLVRALSSASQGGRGHRSC